MRPQMRYIEKQHLVKSSARIIQTRLNNTNMQITIDIWRKWK